MVQIFQKVNLNLRGIVNEEKIDLFVMVMFLAFQPLSVNLGALAKEKMKLLTLLIVIVAHNKHLCKLKRMVSLMTQ